jgi:hypothetical protein
MVICGERHASTRCISVGILIGYCWSTICVSLRTARICASNDVSAPMFGDDDCYSPMFGDDDCYSYDTDSCYCCETACVLKVLLIKWRRFGRSGFMAMQMVYTILLILYCVGMVFYKDYCDAQVRNRSHAPFSDVPMHQIDCLRFVLVWPVGCLFYAASTCICI